MKTSSLPYQRIFHNLLWFESFLRLFCNYNWLHNIFYQNFILHFPTIFLPVYFACPGSMNYYLYTNNHSKKALAAKKINHSANEWHQALPNSSKLFSKKHYINKYKTKFTEIILYNTKYDRNIGLSSKYWSSAWFGTICTI